MELTIRPKSPMMRLRSIIIAVLLLGGCTAQALAQSDSQGDAQRVKGKAAIGAMTARFQDDLRGLGIPAVIDSCRLTEQVAVGVRNSEIAYGAACKMRIGSKPSTEFLICDSDLSGFGALFSGSFVNTPEWIAAFIRKNCF